VEVGPVSITAGGITFDHSRYDARGDVLYLHVGVPREAADSRQTPEGHVVRYNGAGAVIGLTILGARALLDRDGEIALTLPALRLDADTVGPALAAAS
jgi:uncharacterized protein YuzE